MGQTKSIRKLKSELKELQIIHGGVVRRAAADRERLNELEIEKNTLTHELALANSNALRLKARLQADNAAPDQSAETPKPRIEGLTRAQREDLFDRYVAMVACIRGATRFVDGDIPVDLYDILLGLNASERRFSEILGPAAFDPDESGKIPE